jgi:hypothetical protein
MKTCATCGEVGSWLKASCWPCRAAAAPRTNLSRPALKALRLRIREAKRSHDWPLVRQLLAEEQPLLESIRAQLRRKAARRKKAEARA